MENQIFGDLRAGHAVLLPFRRVRVSVNPCGRREREKKRQIENGKERDEANVQRQKGANQEEQGEKKMRKKIAKYSQTVGCAATKQ